MELGHAFSLVCSSQDLIVRLSMKDILRSITRSMIGDEVIPKTEVFSSPDGKQIILLGLRKKSDSFFLEIEITNSGAVKVNPFEARLRLLSVDTLLNPVQASIEALKAGSLAEKKLPLISSRS